MREFTAKSKVVVIGTSAGGIEALEKILPSLPAKFSTTIAIVIHVPSNARLGWLLSKVQENTPLQVLEAHSGMEVFPPKIVFAPPGYHLLIEKNLLFALDSGERHNYARPSIDVLFESAADACHSNLIGVLLTGASEDGAAGLSRIKDQGGLTIVQDPKSAHAKQMPSAALKQFRPDYILTLNEIAPTIASLCS